MQLFRRTKIDHSKIPLTYHLWFHKWFYSALAAIMCSIPVRADIFALKYGRKLFAVFKWPKRSIDANAMDGGAIQQRFWPIPICKQLRQQWQWQLVAAPTAIVGNCNLHPGAQVCVCASLLYLPPFASVRLKRMKYWQDFNDTLCW